MHDNGADGVAGGVAYLSLPQVHVPSLTVFPNFPITKKKIIYRTSCMDFSPHSGFYSLANNKGHAPLFR